MRNEQEEILEKKGETNKRVQQNGYKDQIFESNEREKLKTI
jgi:hypothetical protein